MSAQEQPREFEQEQRPTAVDAQPPLTGIRLTQVKVAPYQDLGIFAEAGELQIDGENVEVFVPDQKILKELSYRRVNLDPKKDVKAELEVESLPRLVLGYVDNGYLSVDFPVSPGKFAHRKLGVIGFVTRDAEDKNDLYVIKDPKKAYSHTWRPADGNMPYTAEASTDDIARLLVTNWDAVYSLGLDYLGLTTLLLDEIRFKHAQQGEKNFEPERAIPEIAERLKIPNPLVALQLVSFILDERLRNRNVQETSLETPKEMPMLETTKIAGLLPPIIEVNNTPGRALNLSQRTELANIVLNETLAAQANPSLAAYTTNKQLAETFGVSQTTIRDYLDRFFPEADIKSRKDTIKRQFTPSNRTISDEQRAELLEHVRGEFTAYQTNPGTALFTSDIALRELYGIKDVVGYLKAAFSPEELALRAGKKLEQSSVFGVAERRLAVRNFLTAQFALVGSLSDEQVLSSKDTELYPMTWITSQFGVSRRTFYDELAGCGFAPELIKKRLHLIKIQGGKESHRMALERSPYSNIDENKVASIVDYVDTQIKDCLAGNISKGDVLSTSQLQHVFKLHRKYISAILKDHIPGDLLAKRSELIELNNRRQGYVYNNEFVNSSIEGGILAVLDRNFGFEIERGENFQVLRYSPDAAQKKKIVVDLKVNFDGKDYFLDYHDPHQELIDDYEAVPGSVDQLNAYGRANLLFPTEGMDNVEEIKIAKKQWLAERGRILFERYKQSRASYFPENNYLCFSSLGELHQYFKGRTTNTAASDELNIDQDAAVFVRHVKTFASAIRRNQPAKAESLAVPELSTV